jgi:chromosome segregation ATPase
MKRPTLTARIHGLEAELARAERDRDEARASLRASLNDASAKQKQIEELERQLADAKRTAAVFAIEILRKYTTDVERCNTCHPELNHTDARYQQCAPHAAADYLIRLR